ncbi:hypothetical protein PRIPAC_77433 [Pristionchus pacificus]|uniref:Methyltransferase n=1 Tax=Pristionchus pacificus TaxID=54126 RepID=A0A8R1Z3B1_PRIPA|nr:hypothetical protein PRIPAC_77433 [Pristionchus pacificus]
MIGAPEAHEMDKAMIFATNAKKVLDIGTFIGASALSWALVLPEDGKVVSTDINHEDLDVYNRKELAGGTVLDASNARGAVINEMNRLTAKDERVLNILLDTADGIHFIVKKRNV